MNLVKTIIRKLANEVHALAWTLAGAITVLITLSGKTQVQGLQITVAALVIHLIGVLLRKDNKE
jgi:hypothetical protein